MVCVGACEELLTPTFICISWSSQYGYEKILFSRLLKSLNLWSLCFKMKMLSERSLVKKYRFLNRLFIISWILEEFWLIGLLVILMDVILFLISSVISGHLVWLSIFRQFSLIVLLGFLIRLILLKLQHLIYQNVSHNDFVFTNSILVQFLARFPDHFQIFLRFLVMR